MSRTKILFATANKGKLREARDILGGSYEVLSPADLGITDDVEETGSTIKENSILKAESLYRQTGLDCFADDTGLEVDALGGEPGVHAARYANEVSIREGGPEAPSHDFNANIDTLLRQLALHPDAPRTARFRCVVTLILDGRMHFFEGTMNGSIASRRAGCEGFGYDPVFVPDGHNGKTLAELGEGLKNEISHRGQSLRAMAAFLKENQ